MWKYKEHSPKLSWNTQRMKVAIYLFCNFPFYGVLFKILSISHDMCGANTEITLCCVHLE